MFTCVESTVSRFRIWVDDQTGLLHRVESYDLHDHLITRMDLKKYRQFGGIWMNLKTENWTKTDNEVIESSTVALESEEALTDVTIDGKRITFDAREEIVLKCGKASITLTRAGKILIRGAYLLSRSTGVNKIKGGSIQLN